MTALAVTTLGSLVGAWRVVRLVGPRSWYGALALVVGLTAAQQTLAIGIGSVLFDLTVRTLVPATTLVVALEVLATAGRPAPATLPRLRTPTPTGWGARERAVALLALVVAGGGLLASAVLLARRPAGPGLGEALARAEFWVERAHLPVGRLFDLRFTPRGIALLAWPQELGGRVAATTMVAIVVIGAGAGAAWLSGRAGARRDHAALVGAALTGASAVGLVTSGAGAEAAGVVVAGTLLAVAVEHARLTRGRWRARRVAPRGSVPTGAQPTPKLAGAVYLRRFDPRPDRAASSAVVAVVALAGMATMGPALAGGALVALGWRRTVHVGARRPSRRLGPTPPLPSGTITTTAPPAAARPSSLVSR